MRYRLRTLLILLATLPPLLAASWWKWQAWQRWKDERSVDRLIEQTGIGPWIPPEAIREYNKPLAPNP